MCWELLILSFKLSFKKVNKINKIIFPIVTINNTFKLQSGRSTFGFTLNVERWTPTHSLVQLSPSASEGSYVVCWAVVLDNNGPAGEFNGTIYKCRSNLNVVLAPPAFFPPTPVQYPLCPTNSAPSPLMDPFVMRGISSSSTTPMTRSQCQSWVSHHINPFFLNSLNWPLNSQVVGTEPRTPLVSRRPLQLRRKMTTATPVPADSALTPLPGLPLLHPVDPLAPIPPYMTLTPTISTSSPSLRRTSYLKRMKGILRSRMRMPSPTRR